ncbi:MAG: hypothetical protein ACR2GD_00230 [Pyrinomonadaceae bacterium]
MENKFWFWTLFIISGTLPMANGWQYFIGGEGYQNSDLRNYAVAGQILFGLAIMCYGFWRYNKNLVKRER